RGTEDGVTVGPLIDQVAIDKVSELVQDARDRGARVLTGGDIGAHMPTRGYFFTPTVLGDVPAGARVLREEVFGPVAPIAALSSDDAAIAAANDTEYGLVAYMFTRDLARAWHVMENLDTGMIGL